MARAAKLKVYRTVAGFHDAYVAASSQKAALAAWGSEKNLFARGLAELVTDKAAGAEALASPGIVIRRSRGTTAEQIAALPDDHSPRRAAAVSKTVREIKSRESRADRNARQPERAKSPKPPPPPKPSAESLERAEVALNKVGVQYKQAIEVLKRDEAVLARRRREVDRTHASDSASAAKHLDDERRIYDAAMKEWRTAIEHE